MTFRIGAVAALLSCSLFTAPAQAAPVPVAAPSFVSAITRNATILEDPRCMREQRTICVDKGARAIYAVEHKRVVHAYAARFGRKGARTREGQFTVLWKSRNHVSSIYGSKMPNSLFFSGGQAIHYSSDFAAVGYAGASHGCVNMRSAQGSRWLFDWASVGTRVLITD